jgi:hypothetical protein
MATSYITRIDIERIGASSAIVRKWNEGWHADDAGSPDVEEYLENVSLDSLLTEYAKQGFAVWIDRGMGHALRGRITRIDLIQCGQNWTVKKYSYGWKAHTRPTETKQLTTQEMQTAMDWLKANKWTVIDYSDRSVAFKGRPQPINDRAAIQSLRRKANDKYADYFVDFAYYP